MTAAPSATMAEQAGLFGALLVAGYAKAANAANAAIAASPQASQVTSSVKSELTTSFAGVESVAQQYPQYADQIIVAAKTSFLKGDQWAYVAGIVAFCFPKREEEALLAAYHQTDVAEASGPGSPLLGDDIRPATWDNRTTGPVTGRGRSHGSAPRRGSGRGPRWPAAEPGAR